MIEAAIGLGAVLVVLATYFAHRDWRVSQRAQNVPVEPITIKVTPDP
jgi:hypothetical protein